MKKEKKEKDGICVKKTMNCSQQVCDSHSHGRGLGYRFNYNSEFRWNWK